MEVEDKVKADVSKDRKEEKEVSKKEKKSRDREKEEKKSKKHRKHSSSRSSSSDSSRSRSRSKKRSKKHRSHKSRRSRERSRDRRSHSRSRKHRSRRSRSKSRDRDRERSRRERDRDRDRDRNRDDKKRSEKGKSKDSGKDRKGFTFDSPPKDMQVAEDTINFAALGIPNLEALKERYPQLKEMDHSELINKLRLIEDMKAIQASKVDRKLYIGNIPAGMTSQMLMDLLNAALQRMNINTEPAGNCIIGAWISPDNHYAFVDFRTPQEATNGFALNSVAIHGQTLKVGRPRSYQQSSGPENPLQILFGSAGIPMDPLAMVGQAETQLPVIETKIQPPSRILILKNMVKIADLEIDEEYQDITEDVKEECAKFGKVLSIKIPRPQAGSMNIPGLGKIFVEFSSIDEAKAARKELQGRIFDESTVEVAYYDEEKYASNDFTEAD